jgi:WD40 repeat protein
MLFGMCFAPDGGRVLTACRDGQASLWDRQSGCLVCSPGRHSFEICAVAFTRDGRRGLVGGRDPTLDTRTAQAWKFITGKPVTPPLGAYVLTARVGDGQLGLGLALDLPAPPIEPRLVVCARFHPSH